MSENKAPQPDESKENASPTEEHAKPVVPWPAWKTLVLIVIALAAIGLATNATIRFEAAQKSTTTVQKPPPTYTGTAPLPITSISAAYNSNDNFVLVFTPCSDAALNSSIESITVQAANQIRSTDGIYVGVFLLPENGSLTYPTLTVKYFSTAASAFPYTFKSNITSDAIYNEYLSLKFLRVG